VVVVQGDRHSFDRPIVGVIDPRFVLRDRSCQLVDVDLGTFRKALHRQPTAVR